MYAIMRKSNSPPVLICQFTWKFANMVLTGYDMLYQGDKPECELILHSLNNP
jgi:hypothetical protein